MAPVLAFADYSKPFLLETDASKDGPGSSFAAEGRRWKISPYHICEVKPSVNLRRTTIFLKLEFLALKWAVTEHFREYLPILT